MLQAGDIVTVRRFGDTAWVIRRREPDGRYRVVCRTTTPRCPDTRGYFYRGRVVGEGDITAVITPAPTFEVGTTLMHDGKSYVVAADNGDSITLTVPATRRALQGYGVLHVPAGNRIAISKADLVLQKELVAT